MTRAQRCAMATMDGFAALFSSLCPLDFRPTITQSDGPIKNQRVLLGIHVIDAKIPQPLKLVEISALCASKRGLYAR